MNEKIKAAQSRVDLAESEWLALVDTLESVREATAKAEATLRKAERELLALLKEQVKEGR